MASALLEGASDIFERGGKKKAEVDEETVRALHAKIGELAVANDFFVQKAQALDRQVRRGMIERSHLTLSVGAQCRLWYTLSFARERISGQVYDYGIVEKPDWAPTILAAGNLSVTAAMLENAGGTIIANGGDVALDAAQVSTSGNPSGKVAIRRVCVIRCSYESSGSVDLVGGQINASGNVDIAASETFRNTGGQVYAQQDLTITAPEVTTESFLAPVLVQRPAGLYDFLSSKAAWIFLRDEFGTLVAAKPPGDRCRLAGLAHMAIWRRKPKVRVLIRSDSHTMDASSSA